jgi:hypothetical protein
MHLGSGCRRRGCSCEHEHHNLRGPVGEKFLSRISALRGREVSGEPEVCRDIASSIHSRITTKRIYDLAAA